MDFNQALQVETDSFPLKRGVSRGEESDEQVEKEYSADEEVDDEKDNALRAFWLHGLEAEVSKHPAVEGDEGVLEGEELRYSEDNYTN